MARIIAYVDGLSFYYGLTKNTPYRWCDLHMLTEKMFPSHEVLKVKLYFGRSKNFPGRPRTAERQNTYARVLAMNPKVEIFTSKFSPAKKYLPLAVQASMPNPDMAYVKLMQEKETDVKLAVDMVIDAFTDAYDIGVIYTNDLDFREPIIRSRKQFGKKIYFVPTTVENYRKVNQILLKSSTNKYFLTKDLLEECQLPDIVVNDKGVRLHKPPEWA